MNCKKTNLLKRKKLIGTLAAGAAAVYGQAEAEAGIIHVSNNPITSNNSGTDPVYWDIDGVGSHEAQIYNSSGSSFKTMAAKSNKFSVATIKYNLNLEPTGFVSEINKNWGAMTYLHQEGNVIAGGFSDDDPGYFGFKFQKDTTDTEYHYGWARMTLTNGDNFGTAVIHEWAYEDTPDTGIKVGDTGSSAAVPEPSSAVTTLGLLAAGAGGLRRWRREKKVAVA